MSASSNVNPSQKPLHHILHEHARSRGTQTSLIWYGTEITWADLDQWSDAFAARLQALGVTKGDPVVLFLGNCPEYFVAQYGVQKIGAIVCPASSMFKEHELAYQVNDLDARFLVTSADAMSVVDKVRAQCSLEHIFVVNYADLLPDTPMVDLPTELIAAREGSRTVPTDCIDFRAVMHSGEQPTAVTMSLDDIALMTYTSGTTGRPKGAMLSYGNALYKARGTARLWSVDEQTMMLSIAPLYHIAGNLLSVDVPIVAGCAQVLMHRFDPLAALQAIDHHRITLWWSVATMNVACMQIPNADQFDLSCLTLNPCTSFGVTLTEELAQRWNAFTKGPCASFEAAYGLSETHTMDTLMPTDAIRWGTQGKAMDGTVIRIVDPDTGAQCAAGTSGEITVRGPGNFKGYWKNPDATAETLHDGWVHTGDMGKLDADGYLTFMGRFKEMIKVSGYSVFPEDVEAILIEHPAVAQAAVIPAADAQKGEVVKAFIVRKAGAQLTAEQLVTWSREHMALYKAPKYIRFIDALPATGSGKVLRRLLKDRN